MKISDLMTPDPVTIHQRDLVKLAKQRMLECQIKHLPVIDDDQCVTGIITDRDIKLKQAVTDDPSFHDVATVSEVCVPAPESVAPDAEAHTALQQMVKMNIGSMLVTDKGRPVGIFTSMDAVRVLAHLLGTLRNQP